MKLDSAPEDIKDSVSHDLNALRKKITQIGKYAGEIINSVRNKQIDPEITRQSIYELIQWAEDSLRAPDDPDSISIIFDDSVDEQSVMADKTFLKMAVLTWYKNAKKYRREEEAPCIKVSQKLL